jgi:hypothetical protein
VGAEPFTGGERKLPAIRAMREKVAKLLGLLVEQPRKAPKPKKTVSATEPDLNASVTEIEAKIAELEQEIAGFESKPEFAMAASVRRGQITRLRKQLPTSAPHTAA